jgi:adenine-specific DNA-methyltransferase
MWFTKSDDYTFNLDPVRVPQKYPSKKYYKGKRKGELSCNPLGANPSDIWNISNVKHNHPEKTIHPCQFPMALVDRLILSLTDEGDLVFDPYMGVGTTVISAVKHNRHGYGCDIKQEYVDIAISRLKKNL